MSTDTPETDRASFMAAHIDGDGVPTDFARSLERERDAQRMLAGELVSAIRANVLRGSFATSTPEQVEDWLAPFVARLGKLAYRLAVARQPGENSDNTKNL